MRAVLIGALVMLTGCTDPSPPAVDLAAAASLAPALERARPGIEQELGIRLHIHVAASGTLAQQITRGAPADVFISADPRWMDELEARGVIDAESRLDLLSNRLVVVAAPGLTDPPGRLEDLVEARFAPLAIGDPSYVPAGRYAEQALRRAGLWDRVRSAVAIAPDVRAALAYVESGQCPAGIVYASDATSSIRVRIAFVIDDAAHDPIVYPAAVIADAPNRDNAMRVLEWLRATQGETIFRDAGFVPQ